MPQYLLPQHHHNIKIQKKILTKVAMRMNDQRYYYYVTQVNLHG